jgi:mono/diheme cytochrome c family protein
MKSERFVSTAVAIAVSALIGAGVHSFIAGSDAWGETTGSSVKQPPSSPKAAAPQIPGFAVRAQIPAAGKQGPPGKAAALIGVWKKGEALFVKNCQSCHGPQGKGNVPNPGSGDGTVPPLNPVDPDMANKNPSVFAANIDRYIQHGSVPDGPDPRLFMPNWGDSNVLPQQDIADMEAYILRLNGVERKKP